MIISMYGSNDRPDARFTYPTNRLPMRMGAPLFLRLPAAASRVFGVPSFATPDADDVVLQMDPSSPYSYTQRGKGLAGLGKDDAPAPVVRPFLNEYLDYANGNPIPLMIGLGALTFITLGAFKVLGRLSG